MLLKKKEVLKLLGISQPSLDKYVKSGHFPKPIMFQNDSHHARKYWLEDDIKEFLEKRKSAVA